jgi:NAD(P)-dependent dehydrogenase (short-subunit alcohol dehydrogenase family)
VPIAQPLHQGDPRLRDALELAPIRVNLIAAGFVDTSLSASILGDKQPRQAARRVPRNAAHPARRRTG